MRYGADPNKQENDEIGLNTPMHMAAQRNMIQVIEKFIASGGDPTIRNKFGFTCLHIACREGYLDLVQLLKGRGVDEDIRDEYGNNASYWAHQNGFTHITAVLSPPLKRSKEEYYEHIKQVWEAHGFKPGGKKKKGKKGGGKKKK